MMEHAPELVTAGHGLEWTAYFAGAVSVLLYKYATALYCGQKQGKRRKQITLEWLFERSTENTASWVTTVGIVWTVGGVYLSGIEWSIIGVEALPVHVSIAFTLGSLMEFIAPAVVKRLMAQLPFLKKEI